MPIKHEACPYQDGQTQCQGYIAYDDRHTNKRPVVLIAHDWSGCNDFARTKAERLAELGYLGFAIDMYGNGQTGNTKEEKSALIQPLIQDRNVLIERITAALTHAKTLPFADVHNIAAIGFCFGGLCVLDLARSGADIRAVVSFHGLLTPPDIELKKPVKAKVLALHGYDDPMVTPEQVMQFGTEMTVKKVDWQLHMYGHTMHAFTNPQANDKAFGTVYDKTADERSWLAMKNFFAEILK